MPREMLIGMTLILTVAVLGAGGEAPQNIDTHTPTAALDSDIRAPHSVEMQRVDVVPAVRSTDEASAESVLTFHSPVGTLQLVGVTQNDSVSLSVRLDETI